jgi:hypothetical protein
VLLRYLNIGNRFILRNQAVNRDRSGKVMITIIDYGK